MLDGTNRYNTGFSPALENLSTYDNINLGQVVETIDPNGLGRIKVSIRGSVTKGGDNSIAEADLPWCFPMLPKFFAAKPKLGEVVLVFTFSDTKKHVDRLYLGPIISQPQMLNNDPRSTTSLAGFTFGSFEPNMTINRIPALKGVFPDEQDISLQGRFNTDMIMKSNEVVIRAGKFVETTPTKDNPFYFSFNNKTQSYLQLRNDAVIQKAKDNESEDKGSIATLVASKINLITHKNGSPRFDVLNQTDLISNEEMLNILEDAHPLLFGDVTIQYLILLKNAFLNHVHNGFGNKPTDLTFDGNKLSVQEFVKNAEALEKAMLSKNIKIN